LHEQNISLQLDQSAKDYLIEKGYNPDFGARPLRRAIEQYVEDPLSEQLLRGEVEAGQRLTVSKDDEEAALTFHAETAPDVAENAGDDTSQTRPESTAEST
jgi:ATP-dependent Clp protease ATP-binding subunit ClpC